jgi:hypothetical protein
VKNDRDCGDGVYNNTKNEKRTEREKIMKTLLFQKKQIAINVSY